MAAPPDERVLRLSRRLAWAPNPVTGPFRRAAAAWPGRPSRSAGRRCVPAPSHHRFRSARRRTRPAPPCATCPPGGPSAARICQLWAASRDPFLASLVAEWPSTRPPPPPLPPAAPSPLSSPQKQPMARHHRRPGAGPQPHHRLERRGPRRRRPPPRPPSAPWNPPPPSTSLWPLLGRLRATPPWPPSSSAAAFLALQPPRTRVLSGLLCGRLDDLLDDPAAVPELIGAPPRLRPPPWPPTPRPPSGACAIPPPLTRSSTRSSNCPAPPNSWPSFTNSVTATPTKAAGSSFSPWPAALTNTSTKTSSSSASALSSADAPEPLQQRIRETILTRGDLRMNPLFVVEQREKLLAQLSAADADTLVRINVRNHNWESLFSYLWVLPARQILAATVAMQHSGWLPEDTDRAALLEKLALLATALWTRARPGDSPRGPEQRHARLARRRRPRRSGPKKPTSISARS